MNTIPNLDHAELVRLLKTDFPSASPDRCVELKDIKHCWNWEYLHLMLAFVQEKDDIWKAFILKALKAVARKDIETLNSCIGIMQSLDVAQ